MYNTYMYVHYISLKGDKLSLKKKTKISNHAGERLNKVCV